MYFHGPPHMAKQKQHDQREYTYSSYVRIRDVALKTCQSRWMIGRSGERGSGISLLAARHDDDDIYIYIYINIITLVFLKIFCTQLCFIKYSYLIWVIGLQFYGWPIKKEVITEWNLILIRINIRYISKTLKVAKTWCLWHLFLT